MSLNSGAPSSRQVQVLKIKNQSVRQYILSTAKYNLRKEALALTNRHLSCTKLMVKRLPMTKQTRMVNRKQG